MDSLFLLATIVAVALLFVKLTSTELNLLPLRMNGASSEARA